MCIVEFLKKSNRWKHLGLGFVYGLAADDFYCVLYGGVGVALALEFKDYQWGGKPDWIDAALTATGAIAGYFCRYGIFNLVETWL